VTLDKRTDGSDVKNKFFCATFCCFKTFLNKINMFFEKKNSCFLHQQTDRHTYRRASRQCRQFYVFLPRDATQSAVCYGKLSVCPSVTWRYRDHIGWNSSKIISPLVSFGYSLSANPNIRDLPQGNTQKFGQNREGY